MFIGGVAVIVETLAKLQLTHFRIHQERKRLLLNALSALGSYRLPRQSTWLLPRRAEDRRLAKIVRNSKDLFLKTGLRFL